MTLTSAQSTPEHLQERQPQRVAFQVTGLYGISAGSVQMPLSRDTHIDSGVITLTMDPDASAASNIGVIDYAAEHLDVRYSGQLVFPGLYELVRGGNHDPGLLAPVKATATDRCTLTNNLSGWHAVGCLEFLPGSYWAGAKGG